MDSIETLAERLMTALNSTSRKIQHEFAQKNTLPLTTPQLFLLHLLSKKERWMVTELAEKMTVNGRAITAMIDRLEQNNYAERQRDEKDRRVVFIRISKEGRKVLKQAGEKRKEILIHYLQQLEEDEITALIAINEKLAHIISKTDQ
ncbi:MAG TPA: MarR family transcriptional regulator [Paenibacillaceae bacterium]|nr:MarR family transcriptional regulator [Paenibacillaceae bacterium]